MLCKLDRGDIAVEGSNTVRLCKSTQTSPFCPQWDIGHQYARKQIGKDATATKHNEAPVPIKIFNRSALANLLLLVKDTLPLPPERAESKDTISQASQAWIGLARCPLKLRQLLQQEHLAFCFSSACSACFFSLWLEWRFCHEKQLGATGAPVRTIGINSTN